MPHWIRRAQVLPRIARCRHKISWYKRRHKCKIPNILANIHYLNNRLRNSRVQKKGDPINSKDSVLTLKRHALSLVWLKQGHILGKLESSLNRHHPGTHILFGPHSTIAIGRMRITLPTGNSPLTISVDIAPEKEPLPVGLDTIEAYGIQPLAMDWVLHRVRDGWKLFLRKNMGIYASVGPRLLFKYFALETNLSSYTDIYSTLLLGYFVDYFFRPTRKISRNTHWMS